MRKVAIIQARTGSSRLPGKVLKELYGKTVLEHDIERLKQSEEIDEIVIATTVQDKDDIIQSEALRCGVRCFRGSETDVLSRYYLAAKENKAEVVIRITSDCPLIDPKETDKTIRFFQKHSYPYVRMKGYPRGLDTEVFGFNSLEEAFYNAKEDYQREHVTPYLYEEGKQVGELVCGRDYSGYRWTLDTEEDFQLIQQIYGYLYHGSHDFYWMDIVRIMEEHPELYDINKDIKQKKLKG